VLEREKEREEGNDALRLDVVEWRPRPGEKEGKRNDKAHAQHFSGSGPPRLARFGRVTLSSTLAVTGPLSRRLSTRNLASR
jgi:hypothetical protein